MNKSIVSMMAVCLIAVVSQATTPILTIDTKQVAGTVAEALSAGRDDHHSITKPETIVPEQKTITDIRTAFEYQVPAFSVVVLKVNEQ